jgi:hypothetical protein
MSAILTWGATTATSGQFLLPGTFGNSVSVAGENTARFQIPRPGTFRNLIINAGGACTVTLRLAGSNTALTVTVGGAATGADTTHQVVVTPAQVATLIHYVSIQVTGAAGTAVQCSVEYD